MAKKKKIVVGLSGGIDSSMALLLLKKQGWDPIGVSLKMPVWKGKKSFAAAKKVCQKLKVPYYIIDVQKEFKKEVVNYFISEFKKNKTPNPCVICNRNLKFKKLFEFAKKKGVKYVATGHYALVRKHQTPNTKSQTYQLLRAKDKEKDQTYNLCFLKREWLPYIIFPLGEYTKKQVCELAKKEGFNFLTKIKSSQDFCYLAGKPINDYLKQFFGKKPGKILNSKGKVLGKHQGLHFYTIGQRKGIKISGGPWFVKDFDIKKNYLIITNNQKDLYKKDVFLKPFYLINDREPSRKIRVMAKVRYRQPLSPAILYPPQQNNSSQAGPGTTKLKLVFDKPQRAVTPGQFAVFYLPSDSEGKGQVCLGGGRII